MSKLLRLLEKYVGPGCLCIAGRDNINKTGHFGPYISGAEVRVRRESTGPAIDDSYTDIPKVSYESVPIDMKFMTEINRYIFQHSYFAENHHIGDIEYNMILIFNENF